MIYVEDTDHTGELPVVLGESKFVGGPSQPDASHQHETTGEGAGDFGEPCDGSSAKYRPNKSVM